MSVILLLLLVVVWMAWSTDEPAPAWVSPGVGLVIFLGGYLLLVGVIGLWSRWLARRVESDRILESSGRFNRVVSAAQIFVPAWLSAGVFVLGWGHLVVDQLLAPIERWSLVLPSLVLGVMPGLLAWMGLWWAQFPVDRAIREQNLLWRLESDFPIHPSPTFSTYFVSKLRMQLLFTVLPIFMIVGVRDAAGAALRGLGFSPSAGAFDLVVSAAAALTVFVIAPEVLRRVLSTESLTDPALRARLEAVSARAGVRCRDVLLWHTHHNVGNAAVMGLLPRFRYVMLSDLLLETLRDEEIVAVFAHEVGHIIHRHMAWYGVFFIALACALAGTASAVDATAVRFGLSEQVVSAVFPFFAILSFVVCFGFVSRRFERQADVYAARTIEAITAAPSPGTPGEGGGEGDLERRTALAERNHPHPGPLPAYRARGPEGASFVGPIGAKVFNAALLRVLEVNNLPFELRGRFAGSLRERIGFTIEWVGNLAGSWLHGTMASRMRFISGISHDPQLTARFDRYMGQVRIALVALLLACGAWAGLSISGEDEKADGAVSDVRPGLAPRSPSALSPTGTARAVASPLPPPAD